MFTSENRTFFVRQKLKYAIISTSKKNSNNNKKHRVLCESVFVVVERKEKRVKKRMCVIVKILCVQKCNFTPMVPMFFF